MPERSSILIYTCMQQALRAAVTPVQQLVNMEMSMNEQYDQDNAIYKVVVNGDGQYSIWPAERELPNGWNEVGVLGTKAECLAYIQKIWTQSGS